ncbi:MAG TPA: hypothetical protein H9780_00875, partial [Candidatus Mediterraneibacter merdavium]|nr:hypothetical protein [Candidatus Mediterraneibacter merdavium]
VYTIILYEKSPKEFHDFPTDYMHRFAQRSDTGIKIDLLQEYVFISLDNFHGILHNNGIRNQLEAWLTFLSVDEPEMIERLIREYPQFEKYYEEIYKLCRNTERVMQMFSEELRELDRNTVQYMIDDMKDEIDAQKETIAEQKGTISNQKGTIDAQKKTIDAQNKEIEELKSRLAELGAKAP